MSVSGGAHLDAAQGRGWALGDKGESTSSPPAPAHGSRLVGGSNLGGSFAVPRLLPFQHPSSSGEASGLVSLSLSSHLGDR